MPDPGAPRDVTGEGTLEDASVPDHDKTTLVTGVAGFIGFHVARRLLREGYSVVGIDNLNDYYDPELKQARLRVLEEEAHSLKKNTFRFHRADIAHGDSTEEIFRVYRPRTVLHFAAQAGVRYSLENPDAYIESNIRGFLNILEGCRREKAEHLLFASSSSVYGLNGQIPFSESHCTSHPISLYGATKQSNEAMAHAYSHLFGIPTTGVRLFTVYGPWGRPDMAPFLFTRAILEGRPIKVFNNGEMERDFTYIDDVVEGILRLATRPATADPEWNPERPDPASSSAPYRIYNIGNHTPVQLMDFISAVEESAGRKAFLEMLPMQPGDVHRTHADIEKLARDTGFHPLTQLGTGVGKFVEWYRSYYTISK